MTDKVRCSICDKFTNIGEITIVDYSNVTEWKSKIKIVNYCKRKKCLELMLKQMKEAGFPEEFLDDYRR